MIFFNIETRTFWVLQDLGSCLNVCYSRAPPNTAVVGRGPPSYSPMGMDVLGPKVSVDFGVGEWASAFPPRENENLGFLLDLL